MKKQLLTFPLLTVLSMADNKGNNIRIFQQKRKEWIRVINVINTFKCTKNGR
jgi:hypothetical protein